MKNILRLILILSTLTSLILIVFLRILISDIDEEVINPEIAQKEAIDMKLSSVQSYTHSQTQKTILTQNNSRNAVSNGSLCGDDCQGKISKSLTKDGLLTPDMIALIRKNPAAFAEQLSNTPVILSRLLTTLKADEEDDNGTQGAALAICLLYTSPSPRDRG